ncbi:MAG TPA: type VI secretion system tip protein TssI/VgrG [Planctomycetota bacterium]
MKADQIVDFESKGVPADTFQVSKVEGAEAVSGLYRYELDLYSKKTDVDFEALVSNPAKIILKQEIPTAGGKRATRNFPIHGVVTRFEQREKLFEMARYRAVLMPTLSKLSLSYRSRTFQNVDIKDLVKAVLGDPSYGPGIPHEIAASGSFAKREYVVQYQESDLDFLQRWLEHEGLFFLFEQGDAGDKVIVANATSSYAALPGKPKVPYRPAREGPKAAATKEGGENPESISSWTAHQDGVTKKVILQDWNYRTPATDLKADNPVHDKGAGEVYAYGEHYKTPAEGKAIAKARAEAILCRQKMFVGEGDCRLLRSGATFTLDEHYRKDFNGEYVLTDVRHVVEQAIEAPGAPKTRSSYKNTFTCIPAKTLFRPERRTPWPRIHGFMNAHVDASGDGKTAELDGEGRYVVKLPFDLKGKDAGKGSRRIRMAQPYAGGKYGIHFPLHKNTEVILAHKDGNPDRPVIVGALYHPEAKSPVLDANQTQGILRSAAENMIRFEDKQDEEHVFTYAKKDHHLRVENETFSWIGKNSHLIVKEDRSEEIGKNHSEKVKENASIDVGKELSLNIGKDHLIQVGGKLGLTVKGDAVHVFKANGGFDVTGDLVIKAQSIVLDATGGITLKSGGSSVVVDAVGVSLKGAIVTIQGDMTKINSGPGSSPKSGSPGSAGAPKTPEAPKEALTKEGAAPNAAPGRTTAPESPPSAPPSSASSSSPAPTAAEQAKEEAKDGDWLGIELKDAEGKPIAGQRYTAKLPDGTTLAGFTGADGKAKVEGVKKGQAQVSFPDLDKDDWKAS